VDLANDTTLAFSEIIPLAEPRPKPRDVGLTEVRTPAHSLTRIQGYVEPLGPYLDSVKWTVGTQRLLSRRMVAEINQYLHSQAIEVSSGGLLETVLPLGAKAVPRYLDESKELGFDIIEISSALVGNLHRGPLPACTGRLGT
jgi:phosphosulfolactate synthase (CoM biosynthesis protein A)